MLRLFAFSHVSFIQTLPFTLPLNKFLHIAEMITCTFIISKVSFIHLEPETKVEPKTIIIKGTKTETQTKYYILTKVERKTEQKVYCGFKPSFIVNKLSSISLLILISNIICDVTFFLSVVSSLQLFFETSKL